MDFPDNDRVKLDITAEGVARVTLARPDKLNALDTAMFHALDQAGQALLACPGLRCVVLTGEGRAFSAGLDLASMAGLTQPDAPRMAERTHGNANLFQNAAMVWRRLPVPVIAAIHGACFGGALQVAGGADLRIARGDARFSVAEIKWGIVPDMGGFALWRGAVRLDVLRELTWAAREFSGTEAQQFGFVTELADDPLARALDIANTIAARSPDAVRAAKALFAIAEHSALDEILLAESHQQDRLIGSPNQMEAVAAELGGRPPRFRDPGPTPA